MGRRRDDDDDDYDDDDDDDDYDKRSVRKRRKKGRSGSSFMDFVLCRAMVGRMVAPIVFWLGSIGLIFYGIRLIVLIIKHVPDTWEKTLGTLYGLCYVILGPLILPQIVSECVILFFNVNDSLTTIKNDLPSDD